MPVYSLLGLQFAVPSFFSKGFALVIASLSASWKLIRIADKVILLLILLISWK